VNNDDIEEAAVNYIQDLLRENQHLRAELSTNDKTAIVDGELKYYDPDKTKKTEHFQWAVKLQCKGHGLKKGEQFKNHAKFKLKKNYLIGFQKSDGVILFAVHIRGVERRAYFLILGPLDVEHELREMGDKKSTTVRLLPFPEDFDAQTRIAKLARAKCQPNNIKLSDDMLSLATGFNVSTVDAIDFNRPGVVGIGTGIPSHVEMKLRDGNHVPVPGYIRFWPEEFVPQELGHDLHAGSIVIKDAHRRLINDHLMELAVTPSLRITLDVQNQSGEVNTSLDESFDEALTNLEFLNHWLEKESFDIGENQVRWKLDDYDFTSQQQSLRIFRDIKALCELLHVDTSLLHVRDFDNNLDMLENIVKYFVYGGKFSLPDKQPHKIMVELGKWQLRFFASHRSDQDFATIKSAGDIGNGQFWWVAKDEPEVHTRITAYGVLTAEELSTTLNLGLEHIIEAYETFVDDDRRAGFANETVLKLVEAADLQPRRAKELLGGARELATWLLTKPEFSEIAQVNLWQIDKRLGNLTDADFAKIRLFRESLPADHHYVAPLKAGASILLGQPDETAFWLERSREDDRTRFTETPIYQLHTNPELTSRYEEAALRPEAKWKRYEKKCIEESITNELSR